MYSNFPLSFFSDFMPSTRERVYIVSDTQYAEAKKAQAEQHIRTLETRAADYQRNLDVVQATITELKTEHGLLPPAKDNVPDSKD